VVDASASRPADSPGRTVNASGAPQTERASAYRNEVSEFCAAVRAGTPVRCGPERARRSAISILTANRSAEQKARLVIAGE
jgi:hypothetical protein